MGSQLNLSELILALISFSYFIKEIRTIDRTTQPPAVTKSISHTVASCGLSYLPTKDSAWIWRLLTSLSKSSINFGKSSLTILGNKRKRLEASIYFCKRTSQGWYTPLIKLLVSVYHQYSRKKKHILITHHQKIPRTKGCRWYQMWIN